MEKLSYMMPKQLTLTSKSQCLKIISQVQQNKLNRMKERIYLTKEARQDYQTARSLFHKHLLTMLSSSTSADEKKTQLRQNLPHIDEFHSETIKDSKDELNKSEYVYFNSILGPSYDQITEKSLQIEQLMRKNIELDIIKRENEQQPVRFHYDQYLIEKINADDQQTKQRFSTSKPLNEKIVFKWNEFPSSKRMNMIPSVNKPNEPIANKIAVNEDFIEFLVNDESINKNYRSKTLSTKNRKSIYSRPPSSKRPKSSLSSVSSLDEQELDLINQQIEKLNQLVFEKTRIENPGETTELNNLNMIGYLEHIDSHSIVETTEDNDSEQIKLPNYITCSVKKSHQYAVNNWLNSSYRHIG